MKITAKQAQDIIFDETDEFDIVEDGDWISEGKYEVKEVVFSKDGKFYSFYVSRSGSPFTDWYYEWEDTSEFDCVEVVQKEIVTKIWVKA